jgi:hypothetical protein
MAGVGAPIGNKYATKEHRQWQNALNRAIAQDDGKRLRDSAEKLLDAASTGEPWAIRELADRLDGKPAQQIQVQGDADQPLRIVHESK